MLFAGLFSTVGSKIIEDNPTFKLFCDAYPRDRRLSEKASKTYVECQKKRGYRFTPLNTVQVLKLSQLWLCFAILFIGLGGGLITFVLETLVARHAH